MPGHNQGEGREFSARGASGDGAPRSKMQRRNGRGQRPPDKGREPETITERAGRAGDASLLSGRDNSRQKKKHRRRREGGRQGSGTPEGKMFHLPTCWTDDLRAPVVCSRHERRQGQNPSAAATAEREKTLLHTTAKSKEQKQKTSFSLTTGGENPGL